MKVHTVGNTDVFDSLCDVIVTLTPKINMFPPSPVALGHRVLEKWIMTVNILPCRNLCTPPFCWVTAICEHHSWNNSAWLNINNEHSSVANIEMSTDGGGVRSHAHVVGYVGRDVAGDARWVSWCTAARTGLVRAHRVGTRRGCANLVAALAAYTWAW